MATVNEKMSAIANAIREKTGATDMLSLDGMASAIPNVYDAGKAEGVEHGKQVQYDEFWDSCQDYGKRTNYEYAFCGQGWNDITFKPKYPMIPQYAGSMFRDCKATNVDLTDIVTINSQCWGYTAMCRNFIGLVKFGDFYCSHNNCQEIFHGCTNLTTVGKVTSKSTTTYSSTFYNCTSLTDITFAGTIANNLDMRYSPLNKASITNIVNALSSTTTGKTLTLKQTAKEVAFTDEEWAGLIAKKTNWTISLV